MPGFDPYVAFFRVAYLKTLNNVTKVVSTGSTTRAKGKSVVAHDASKMVTCFVTPQNYTFGYPRFAMREDIVNNLNYTVDLLGGDYRKQQGGNCFDVNLGNCICSFRQGNPILSRRVHFEPVYSECKVEDKQQKIAQLVNDTSNSDLLDLFELYEPEYENWWRFYGGMLEVPSWPTIENIRQ